MRQGFLRRGAVSRLGCVGINLGCARTVAGVVLIGLGMVIFWGRLDQAAAQAKHFFGAISGQELGVAPTVVLATSQVSRACGANYERFLRAVFPLMLASSWPLILVMAGTALSREAFAAADAEKKDSGRVDPEGRGSTLE